MSQVAEWRARLKDAKRFGVAWVDAWIRGSGGEHGDSGGEKRRRGRPASEKKRRAAFLMILHNKLGLREISKLAGVSEGLLRLWRTEAQFKRVSDEACLDLAAQIMGTIEMEFKKLVGEKPKKSSQCICHLEITGLGTNPFERLIELIPFFNMATFERCNQILEKKVEEEPAYYLPLSFVFLKSFYSFIDPDDRSWLKKPAIVGLIKFYTNIILRRLTDPTLRKTLTDQEASDLGDVLQKVLFQYLNILAG